MSTHCRLCGKSVEISHVHDRSSPNYVVDCRRCGVYEADDGAWHMFAKMEEHPSDRHLLSALTRTAPVRGVGRVLIDASSYVAVREERIREPTLVERREALMDWLAFESRKNPNESPYVARVKFNPAIDYPVAYCRPVDGDWHEWTFILQPLLERGLVMSPENGALRITDKGWELIEARPKATGSIGFVAMAFKDMNAVRDAIEAGIGRAGYKPLRIDGDHFIGGVMDRIIAKIRESRFVVADFTGNRGGVYYEAGFALGLGVPVFTLCRSDCTEGDDNTRVHFDVRHLNLLTWDPQKLTKLTEDLEARIVAVLGPGPLPRPVS